MPITQQVLVKSVRDELLISPPFAVDRAAAGPFPRVMMTAKCLPFLAKPRCQAAVQPWRCPPPVVPSSAGWL